MFGRPVVCCWTYEFGKCKLLGNMKCEVENWLGRRASVTARCTPFVCNIFSPINIQPLAQGTSSYRVSCGTRQAATPARRWRGPGAVLRRAGDGRVIGFPTSRKVVTQDGLTLKTETLASFETSDPTSPNDTMSHDTSLGTVCSTAERTWDVCLLLLL